MFVIAKYFGVTYTLHNVWVSNNLIINKPKLGNLKWDTLNTLNTLNSEYPMWTLLISCLINSFLDIEQKNKKTDFSRLKRPSRNGYSNRKWRGKF